MQALQILIMTWWLILIFFLNPAPCFCYFHSSVIGGLYNVLFGFNEKSNAQLLFSWKVLKGATLKEMRTGCERLFLPSETSWEDRVVGLPGWKKGAYLDEDLQVPIVDASNMPPVDTGVGHLTQFMFMAFGYNWDSNCAPQDGTIGFTATGRERELR